MGMVTMQGLATDLIVNDRWLDNPVFTEKNYLTILNAALKLSLHILEPCVEQRGRLHCGVHQAVANWPRYWAGRQHRGAITPLLLLLLLELLLGEHERIPSCLQLATQPPLILPTLCPGSSASSPATKYHVYTTCASASRSMAHEAHV